MNTEEKAKAYDEALERAREWHNDLHITIGLKGNLEDIFPELKESEDGDNKRISKEITRFLKQNNGWNREWLDWLEKQSEQKSGTIDIDKIVSKYSHTKDGNFGLPVNCQIRAYRQGINDVLNLLSDIEKQDKQKVPVVDFKAEDWYVSKVDGKIYMLNIWKELLLIKLLKSKVSPNLKIIRMRR